MQGLIEQYGLALVFANVLALSLGLPVPALPTLVLVGAGYALRGGSDAWLAGLAAWGVSVGASLLGDLAWYLAGRRFGNRTLQSLCRLSLSRDTCMKQTERFFSRWGVRVLAVAKFVPGLSMVSVPMAGAMRVRPGAFLRYDAFGASLWALVGLGLGAVFADQVQDVLGFLSELGSGAVAVLVALLAGYVGWRWWRRHSLLRSLDHTRIAVDELVPLLDGDESLRPTVLDIRAPGYRDLQPYTIPGAVFADERQLAQILASVPRERSVVIYCACPDEVSAAWLAGRMRERGYHDVRPLRGGLDAWRDAGHPVTSLLPVVVVGGAEAVRATA
ncbi:DedA family protein/thiosulfate sulfurtransferase GlpE [Xanthomonas cannabis]|uniref:Membrane protein DedA with SNARE-associated domain/rhodanese-related sulfurtransferase n=1 Tax=Xanthomonas cannabis TaxID=1885674 RepID=A0ABR6JS30_9XANT|nr:DedA family protein/thiosulfate sulfurtransferase GlpE [Xanthomonas cannabis]MBB4595096.1 membrane protein DedA with SNARE-associated domain/rhodanese-related sulfurtransferase [Xanthomonas cannabis]MBB5523912.1 membrane protein DedA with SNARE-associated domain/rhodanese-related sulfurtransferase [Xanthomonas cannabis]